MSTTKDFTCPNLYVIFKDLRLLLHTFQSITSNVQPAIDQKLIEILARQLGVDLRKNLSGELTLIFSFPITEDL